MQVSYFCLKNSKQLRYWLSPLVRIRPYCVKLILIRMHLRRRVCSRMQTVFTITSIILLKLDPGQSSGFIKLEGLNWLGGGGGGSTNVRLFVSCQLKIIRGFNKHRRPTKRVGYMAQRSRLLFPPKKRQLA